MQASSFRAGVGRAESDKADAKGGAFLSPFVPAGETPDAAQRAKTGRASFILWRGHPKLFIAKQKRSEALFFCRADGIRSYLLLSKKGRAEGRRQPEKRTRMAGCHADRRRKKAGLSPSHRRKGRGDASDGRNRKKGAATTLKSAERRHEGATADTSCFFSAQGHLKLFIAWQKRWEIRGGVPAGRRNTVCNRKKNAVVTSEQTEVKLFC